MGRHHRKAGPPLPEAPNSHGARGRVERVRTRVLAGLASGQAALVDPIQGKVIHLFDVGGGAVFGVAIAPDGRTVATGSDAGSVRLWDVATGRKIGSEMKTADGLVIGIRFSRDGRTLLTTGSDGSVRLIDVATQRAIGNPFPVQDQNWGYGVFGPDGSKVIVVFSDGMAGIWPAALQSWEDHACAVARRSFTSAEWQQFVGPGYPHPTLCG